MPSLSNPTPPHAHTHRKRQSGAAVSSSILAPPPPPFLRPDGHTDTRTCHPQAKALPLLFKEGIMEGLPLVEDYAHTDACEAYIWIDVQLALGVGVRFLRDSVTGVVRAMTASNNEGAPDVIPPSCIYMALELRGSLREPHPSKVPHMRLLSVLFAGCSRLVATPIETAHDGHLGGRLLVEVQSYELDGPTPEPSILKIEPAPTTRAEASHSNLAVELIGLEAVKVVRGPRYVSGKGIELGPVEANSAPASCFGAVVLELVGACWVLPQLRADPPHGAHLRTATRQLVTELASAPGSHIGEQAGGHASGASATAATGGTSALDGEAMAAGESTASGLLDNLWGAGGALRNLALRKHTRAADTAAAPGKAALLGSAVHSTAAALVQAFLPPDDIYYQLEREALLNGEEIYVPPPTVKATIDALKLEVTAPNKGWVKLKGSLAAISKMKRSSNAEGVEMSLIEKREAFLTSFVHECDGAVWGDAACAPIIALLAELDAIRKSKKLAPWLHEWRPLRTYQHGDLHSRHILLDMVASQWLVGFHRAGMHAPFEDVARLIGALLFEHLPLAITYDELRRWNEGMVSAALRLPAREASALVKMVSASESLDALKATLAAKSQGSDQGLLAEATRHVVASEDEADASLALACSLVDCLLATEVGGAPPEIWEMASAVPAAAWPAHATRTFRLAQSALKMCFDLVVKCSAREEAARPSGGGNAASCLAADLHSTNFLLPLLHRGLCAIRYVDYSSSQKRLAWYAARTCASQLLKVRHQSSESPPPPLSRPPQSLTARAGCHHHPFLGTLSRKASRAVSHAHSLAWRDAARRFSTDRQPPRTRRRTPPAARFGWPRVTQCSCYSMPTGGCCTAMRAAPTSQRSSAANGDCSRAR